MTNQNLSAHGFSAWITVEGEPLPVYQDETTDMTCTAWIPSTVGQTFSVWWKDESKSRIATSGHVFIDGNDVASAILRPGRTRPVERAGAKTSARRLRPFRFAVLHLTDDETVASKDDATLGDMGTIKVEISRVKLGDEVPFKGYEAQDPGPVHERAKKLGAHCTTYGPSKRAPALRTVAVSTAPYDPEAPGPYITFVFRYRSEDLLRANGVISSVARKRGSSGSDDEVIEISDSETENASNRPAKKRARTNAPSEAPVASENDLSLRIDDVEKAASEHLDEMEKVDGNLQGDTDRVSEPPRDDVEAVSDGLGLGVPSLLQSENMDASQAAEESQTLADDSTQMSFGASSGLLKDDADE